MDGIRPHDREAPSAERIPDAREARTAGPTAAEPAREEPCDRQPSEDEEEANGESASPRARRRRRGSNAIAANARRVIGNTPKKRRLCEGPSSIHAKISARSVGASPAPLRRRRRGLRRRAWPPTRNRANRREPHRGSISAPRLQTSRSEKSTPRNRSAHDGVREKPPDLPGEDGARRENEPRRRDRPREGQEVSRGDEDEERARDGRDAPPARRRRKAHLVGGPHLPLHLLRNLSSSLSEDRAADAHERRAFLDGGLEVVAHSHREARRGRASSASARRRREVRARVAGRRDRHESPKVEVREGAHDGDERRELAGFDARFRGLAAEAHLDERAEALAERRRPRGRGGARGLRSRSSGRRPRPSRRGSPCWTGTGPMRCAAQPGGRSGNFASASWTRFSPNAVTPAA